MSKLLNKIYNNNISIYKILLSLVAVVVIVYLFPKRGKFKYDYIQGKPWQYENLYAPFDFAIQKSEAQIEKEKKDIIANSKTYFTIDSGVKKEMLDAFDKQIKMLDDSVFLSNKINNRKLGVQIIDEIYKYGLVNDDDYQKIKDKNQIIALKEGNKVKEIIAKNLTSSKQVIAILESKLKDLKENSDRLKIQEMVIHLIKPNVAYDHVFTTKLLESKLETISLIKGKVAKDELIILKGDIVNAKVFNTLESFKKASQSQIWSESKYNWVVFGYTILVSLALLMLLLFIRKYHPRVFEENRKVTFIIFNVVLMVLVQTLVIKYKVEYLYVVPLIILPIVIKAFFDSIIALFTYLLTVLLLGFIVPNSFEYIYLHLIAGIIAILTVTEMYKRANLFISIAKITLTYMITYFAFSIIKEGGVESISQNYFLMFFANGLLSFLAFFFVYFYEKVFGLVSDVTLLELSNTNSKLLRELNDKAPGTFQHTIQVANLAEACANEIGANSMLVRTGALYHDIGKMDNPQYFIENQSTGVNPHNDLSPLDSAKIIIDHVIKGIEIAKKNKLPDRIIDFIRTHHGTSLVYYFYKQELDENPDVDVTKFKYSGPIPYSKETAILMMCDASEAASKSLRQPTAQSIDELIDKIIEKQTSENQFINSNITFREIEKIKKVIKNKLMNIYHLRVEYPD